MCALRWPYCDRPCFHWPFVFDDTDEGAAGTMSAGGHQAEVARQPPGAERGRTQTAAVEGDGDRLRAEEVPRPVPGAGQQSAPAHACPGHTHTHTHTHTTHTHTHTAKQWASGRDDPFPPPLGARHLQSAHRRRLQTSRQRDRKSQYTPHPVRGDTLYSFEVAVAPSMLKFCIPSADFAPSIFFIESKSKQVKPNRFIAKTWIYQTKKNISSLAWKHDTKLCGNFGTLLLG